MIYKYSLKLSLTPSVLSTQWQTYTAKGKRSYTKHEHACQSDIWIITSTSQWRDLHYLQKMCISYRVRDAWLLAINLCTGQKICNKWSKPFLTILTTVTAYHQQNSSKLLLNAVHYYSVYKKSQWLLMCCSCSCYRRVVNAYVKWCRMMFSLSVHIKWA